MSHYIAIFTITILFIIFVLWKLIYQRKFYKKECISFAHSFSKTTMPLIKVHIFDTYYYLLIDSGANVNVMDENYIINNSRFCTQTGTKNTALYGLSVKDSPNEYLISFDFNNMNFENTEFLSNNQLHGLSLLTKKMDYPVIGLLGSDFLKKFKCQIDFEKMVIWVNFSRGE